MSELAWPEGFDAWWPDLRARRRAGLLFGRRAEQLVPRDPSGLRATAFQGYLSGHCVKDPPRAALGIDILLRGTPPLRRALFAVGAVYIVGGG